AGPLLGGVLIDVLGWRAIFAASFAFGAPTIALAVHFVRESRDPDPPPADWAGVATLSAGLFLAVYAVLRGNDLGWTSSTVLGGLAGGAVGAYVYVTLFLLDAQGRDPVETGLVLLPLAVMSFAVSALAGRVSERL